MRKRLGLFVVGLVLALGAFWAYQWVTGASWTLTRKAENRDRIVTPVARTSPEYEFRDQTTGVLKYLLRADSWAQVLDSKGNVVPGLYNVTRPSGTFYSKDGRTMSIRADNCRLTTDQIPKGTKMEKDTGLPLGRIRVATLSGNVLLTVSSKPGSSGDLKPEDGEWTVAFDDAVDILPNQNLLTSPGAVHVRSETLEYDGASLNLSYNKDDQRVEFLRIDQGNQVVIRNVGNQGFSLDGSEDVQVVPAATLPAVVGGGKVAAAGTRPAVVGGQVKGSKGQTYRLAFGDVLATQGLRSLKSPRLFVVFMPANPAADKVGAAAATQPATTLAAATQRGNVAESGTRPGKLAGKAGTRPAIAGGPRRPMAAPGPNDLVIRWKGPMEMRPATPQDVQLSDAKDSALEAIGTQDEPVILHDGARVVTASGEGSRLWFHTAESRVEIEPGRAGTVDMQDPVQGKVVCQGVSFIRGTRAEPARLVLKAGSMEVPQAALRKNGKAGTVGGDQTPLVAAWKDTADIELASIDDPKNPGKKLQAIRRALLTGDVTIKDPAFELGSKKLDMVMARTGDPKTPQALESLVATGDVHIKYARAGESLDDAGKPEGLTGKKLEVFTALRPGTNVPAPSRVLATGDVVAWTYSEMKDDGAATRPAAVKSGGPHNLTRETIHTQRLDVALETREKGSPEEAGPMAGLAMGSGASMKSMLASGGVKVEIEGMEGTGNRLVVATAQTLTADHSGRAVLDGDSGIGQLNGAAKRVLIVQGENKIVADEVILDQKAHTMDVPGPGVFTFVDVGKKGEPDALVQITSKKMVYDDKARIAKFTGHTESKRIAGPDEASDMTCEESLVVALTPGHTLAAADKSKDKDPASGLAYLMAKGDVKANGLTLDPLTHGKLTSMALRAPELRYTAATEILEIPGEGSMVLEDYRPDKAAGKDKKEGPDSKGMTVFHWYKSVVYTGHKGKVEPGTIKMTGDVQMTHIPLIPFRMPNSVDNGTKVAAIKKMDLRGETLTAYLAQTADAGGGPTVASPVGLGAGGDMKLSRAVVDGKAELDLGDEGISGYSLEYDDAKRFATARGKGDVEAVVRRPETGMMSTSEYITWNLATNEVNVAGARGAFVH